MKHRVRFGQGKECCIIPPVLLPKPPPPPPEEPPPKRPPPVLVFADPNAGVEDCPKAGIFGDVMSAKAGAAGGWTRPCEQLERSMGPRDGEWDGDKEHSESDGTYQRLSCWCCCWHQSHQSRPWSSWCFAGRSRRSRRKTSSKAAMLMLRTQMRWVARLRCRRRRRIARLTRRGDELRAGFTPVMRSATEQMQSRKSLSQVALDRCDRRRRTVSTRARRLINAIGFFSIAGRSVAVNSSGRENRERKSCSLRRLKRTARNMPKAAQIEMGNQLMTTATEDGWG